MRSVRVAGSNPPQSTCSQRRQLRPHQLEQREEREQQQRVAAAHVLAARISLGLGTNSQHDLSNFTRHHAPPPPGRVPLCSPAQLLISLRHIAKAATQDIYVEDVEDREKGRPGA